ncbi:MAG TPA: hypothetical protein VMT66_17730 [Steroidobacteraceae bacterium]|nr:hypothetical protein [Steroidobacteraceae bacterium]
MRRLRPLIPLSLVLTAPFFFLSGCVVEHDREVDRVHTPTEGYYDREHHRYYHENAWIVCEDRDPHCPS